MRGQGANDTGQHILKNEKMQISNSTYVVQPAVRGTAIGYAQDVVAKKIIAGKFVTLACERFLNDLEHGSERGFYWDEAAAQHAVDFFGFLRHTKGVWAKKVETSGFLLSPWQVFVLANLFGFIMSDSGQRRFREAHIEVARKNGKSTFIAGIGLYMMYADGEPGAEVYSAATTKEQAAIVFNAGKEMVTKSPALSQRIRLYRTSLVYEGASSKFAPLAADAKTLDGLNVHCALIDELHEHPNRTLYDVLNTATGSRSQPLILAITTAGFDREGICWDQRTYGIKILTSVLPDDNFFAFIACLDGKDSLYDGYPGDDWEDEKCWAKANPNLGVSVSLEAIRPNFIKAKEQPAALNEFLRKHLNVWTSSDTSWLVAGCWEKNCAKDSEHTDIRKLRSTAYDRLKGRRCFGGLDLSSANDLTAFALVFPPCGQIVMPKMEAGHIFVKTKNPDQIKCLPEKNAAHLVDIGTATYTRETPKNWPTEVVQESDDKWRILVWFWIPKAFVNDRMKKNRAPYDAWIKADMIIPTEGNSIDQESIRNKILELNHHFRIKEVGFDGWGAEWIGPKLLADGIQMVKIAQRFENLSNPTKTFTGFLTAGAVEHFNNPVLRWMASNVQLLLDTNSNERPDKGKSKNKIDGIVATVMAFGRALANPTATKDDAPDRYEVRTV